MTRNRFLLPATIGMFFLALILAFFVAGCASLTPYKDIREELPKNSLLSIDGQRVHVQQAGRGDPIILLHGFAASTFSFHKLTPILSQQYRVIAIDLNGFGYTERPEKREDFSPSGQVAMVKGVMEKLNIESATFVGHSFGATLSLLMLQSEPDLVRRLVLISPPDVNGPPPPGWIRNAVGRKIAYGATRWVLSRPERFKTILGGAYHRKEVLTPEVSEAYRKRLLVEGLDRAFNAFARQATAGGEIELSLEQIENPTLVLAGKQDRIVPLEHCRAVAEGIPNARLIVLDQSGHSSPEEQPESVARAILEFLRE